ncbi:hypothetical protein N1851_026307 [Merluccius polli]|uniref:Uncharacterized protein n=1 Tax=Merluccius polli TaxID=89951 RepID=A0AA47MC25_MERPO|nr:hypothetical protein N1851_026307 [Merluccius polli]
MPYIPQNAKHSSACPESSALLAEDSVHIEHADDKSEGFETEPKSRQIVEDMKEVQASSLTKDEKQEPVLNTDVGVNNEDKAMLATQLNQIDTYTENDPQESSDSEENAMPDLQTDQHLEENICKHQIDTYTENDPQESSGSEENAMPDLQTEEVMLEQNQYTVEDIGGSCHEKVSLELNITQNVAMEPDMHLPNDEEKEGSLTLKLDSPVPPKCSGIQDNDTEINSQVEDYNTLAEKLDSDVVEYQELPKELAASACCQALMNLDQVGVSDIKCLEDEVGFSDEGPSITIAEVPMDNQRGEPNQVVASGNYSEEQEIICEIDHNLVDTDCILDTDIMTDLQSD